jgi:hypothetical protein
MPLYLYISPAKVSIAAGGVPQFRATLLEGFTTHFSALLVSSDGGTPVDVTSNTIWEENTPTEPGERRKLDLGERGAVQPVTAVHPGQTVLRATYQGLSNTVSISIDESDLLLYAPDGYVYRIPTEAWTSAPIADPNTKSPPTTVVKYDPQKLPRALRVMLVNEVALANIPTVLKDIPSTTQGTDTRELAPATGSDNITCFLLNLNSLLLSHTPSSPGTKNAVTSALEPKQGSPDKR